MELPKEFKGLLDPKLFLDANDTEANTMKGTILKLRPQDPEVVDNRRKRIQELGELLGYHGTFFHTLFNDGSVGPNDYTNSKTKQEPVHRISAAILAEKMELPKEFQNLINPKLFLDANDTQAAVIVKTIQTAKPRRQALTGIASRTFQKDPAPCGPDFARLRWPVGDETQSTLLLK